MNKQDESRIKEIASRIFSGKLTWEEARKEAGIAEKTLRSHIIKICTEDLELRDKFEKYSNKRNKHTDINVPAVIINMVKQGDSLKTKANSLGISKESLRTLIDKEKNTTLNELLRLHFDKMRHKRSFSNVERKEVDRLIEEYIEENEHFITLEKLDRNSIVAEKKNVESFLRKVEQEKSTGKSELQIARENNWGPAKIRRTRERLQKLNMLSTKEDKKDSNPGDDELPI